MTYVIGDVHGHYYTLLALIEKLPKESIIIFVGDLIDRGLYSKEVIKLLRKNSHPCVLGNHEEMMITSGENLLYKYKAGLDITHMHEMWMGNGGKETLYSYDLIEIVDNKILLKNNPKALEQFKDDIAWLETLPLFIELKQTKDNKPIVISHSNIGNIWHHRNDPKEKELFKEYAIWKRDITNNDTPIFNIFGHTPIDQVDTNKPYINIDTGCYINDVAYSRLSAYCIEDNSVTSIRKVEKDTLQYQKD